MLVLTKETRGDDHATLSAVGRDIDGGDTVVRFNKDTCRWESLGDAVWFQEQQARQDLLWEYNQTKPSQQKERTMLLQKMLAECGEDVYIEAPFYANWGGFHCHFGKGVYANYHLTCVDDTHIYVGDYTMFGPNVTVAAVGNPCRILREVGEKDREFYWKDRRIEDLKELLKREVPNG